MNPTKFFPLLIIPYHLKHRRIPTSGHQGERDEGLNDSAPLCRLFKKKLLSLKSSCPPADCRCRLGINNKHQIWSTLAE